MAYRIQIIADRIQTTLIRLELIKKILFHLRRGKGVATSGPSLGPTRPSIIICWGPWAIPAVIHGGHFHVGILGRGHLTIVSTSPPVGPDNQTKYCQYGPTYPSYQKYDIFGKCTKI